MRADGPRRLPATLVGLGLALASPIAAVAETVLLDARALYERSVSHNLRLSRDSLAIELEEGELFEDDGAAAGYSYKPNEEVLSPETWVKKDLIIPNPRSRAATLLVGPGGDLRAVINGKRQELGKSSRVGNYWQAYSLEPGVLKRGRNELVLYGSGKLWIARDDEFAPGSRAEKRHPNRSAKSKDRGKTWDYEHLGSDGADGEYYVRVFLDHYRSRGSLTLPVLDLGNLGGKPLGVPIDSVGPVRITVRADTGRADRILAQVRSGTTYTPKESAWSRWRDLGERGGVLENPSGRYLQLALVLASRDPLETPRLKSVTVAASPESPDTQWTKSVRVLEAHNEEIFRTTIPFEYEPFDDPKLKRLRERYELDKVVCGAKSELDLILRLARWSSTRFTRGHLKESYPPWDALEILRLHADGTPVGGFCLQYNLVFLQACESFGLPGRFVSIGPGNLTAKIRGGHEAVEIWSNEYKKWIYVDGNSAWYAIDESSKQPLSLLELRQRQLQALRGQPERPTALVKIAASRYGWTGLEGWPPFIELRLIPRSNFLEERAPLPLNQGRRGWFWTGHFVFTDREYPARPLYGNRIGKPSNFNWTLNQAHYVLEATETAGLLRVHLDTETPGFETFLAGIDSKGKKPVASIFTWKLHKGKNHLEVLPRNRAGREGIASWIVIDYR